MYLDEIVMWIIDVGSYRHRESRRLFYIHEDKRILEKIEI